MGVDGKVAGVFGAGLGFGRAVFEEVAAHPMILAGSGEVLVHFAEVAAEETGAAFAGGTDEGDCEAGIESHGDERGFAETGDAFDADFFWVYGEIGFEVIERAGSAPAPGAEGAPIFGFAGLALVD